MKYLLSTHLASHNLKPSDTAISETIYLAHFHTYKKQNTNPPPLSIHLTSLSTHSLLPLNAQKK